MTLVCLENKDEKIIEYTKEYKKALIEQLRIYYSEELYDLFSIEKEDEGRSSCSKK